MNPPTIVFRTKATPHSGFGHLRRCISLAKTLKRLSTQPLFIINQDDTASAWLKQEHLDSAIVDQQDECDLTQTYALVKQQPPAAIIFDSYDLPVFAFSKFAFLPTVVIDDRSNIDFPVNLVVNGSETQSQAISKDDKRYLYGPEFLLIDETFLSPATRIFKNPIENILITVGGSDPEALSINLLTWTRQILNNCKIHLVVGPFFSENLKTRLETLLTQDKNLSLHHKPAHLFDLMIQCDLAITAGGQTTFELAVTGTPAIAIQIIDNQKVNLELLSTKGSLISIGQISEPQLRQKFEHALKQLIQDKQKRKDMSKIGKQVVDGLGAERVAKTILNLIKE